MFRYLVLIQPLGLMYGSAGNFLSSDNLVGRSGRKFPPDAATLSGLILSTSQNQQDTDYSPLKRNLHVTGPFWAYTSSPERFYLPLPRIYTFGEHNYKTLGWRDRRWYDYATAEQSVYKLKSEYTWQRVDCWGYPPEVLHQQRQIYNKRKERKELTEGELPPIETQPWEFVSTLHPKMEVDERHVEDGGLFLEYAVQVPEGCGIVYLSTHAVEDGWYRFGGENHLVELSCQELSESSTISQLLRQPIKQTAALITPGVWGDRQLSYRYPLHPDFPKNKRPNMVTDRPVPYRYRLGASTKTANTEIEQHSATGADSVEAQTGQAEIGSQQHNRLSIGRYAVPSGSVYAFGKPLPEDKNTWWQFPADWFPADGASSFSLKHLGVNLCLPIEIPDFEPASSAIAEVEDFEDVEE
ncbi:MAG: type III-B CRISPR module-associated Cmr3 family protein [Cyanobacteria bacterium P01_H01_bin.121]